MELAAHAPPTFFYRRGLRSAKLSSRACGPECYRMAKPKLPLDVAPKKKPNTRKAAEAPPTTANNDHATWPDAWKALFDNLYSLAQTGKIYGLVALFLAATIAILAYRLPPESLLKLVTFLVDEHNYILYLLAALLLLSSFANVLQWRIYMPKINELAQQKKDLMLGLSNGELSPLKAVQSSSLDLETGQTLKPETQDQTP